MSEESQEIKRWTARRKAEVVTEIIKGKTTASEVARTHDLTIGEVEQWMSDFIEVGKMLGHLKALRCKRPASLWSVECSERAKAVTPPASMAITQLS